jgi:predicted nucleic acid-binding protein
MDTSTFTHFYRAGYDHVLATLAPQGVVLVPREVELEIDKARNLHARVPSLDSVAWTERVFMTDDEQWTATQVKVVLGGGTHEHVGECAVIACAKHRGLVAVLDERAAVKQATAHAVSSIDTMRIAADAHRTMFMEDLDQTVALVDALLETGMWLPVKSGAELFG